MEQASSSLNPEKTYNISIRFHSNGFSLLIYDKGEKLITSKQIFASIDTLSETEITTLIAKESDIEIHNKNIELIYEADRYTVVPSTIFKSEDAESLLNFHFQPSHTSSTLWNRVLDEEVVVIFSIPSSLKLALQTLFPSTTITHHISHFIQTIKAANQSSLHIWVRSTKMDVVVFKNGNLRLVNSFSYQTTEDMTYHTLNIYEQLQLDTEKHSVYIYNDLKKEELKKMLKRYVGEVVSS